MEDTNSLYRLKHTKKINKNFYVLHSTDHTTAVPVVNNIAYFNEADFYADQIIQHRYETLIKATEGYKREYESFVSQKGRRPNYDIYACFQSFNEAFKAFFPFIKSLKKNLKKGDIILNLWDRTGWLAALLQGLFPEQKVITLWEGDKDVLGYKGFHFWYGNQSEENNFQLAFANLNKPLPFEDDSISFVFGLDTFHRFDQSLLLTELLRITKKDAAIIFPHVHLSNSEPEPFFERGCRQLHGLDYDSYFQHLFKNTNRKGFIFPEPELFSINELYEKGDYKLVSQPNSHHYNSTIAILPKKWEKEELLQAFRFEDFDHPEACYLLINPLLHIDYSQQKVLIDRSKYSDQVGYLLDRHPIYMEKLKGANQYQLSENQTKALYLAAKLERVSSIADILKIQVQDILEELKELQECDIIQLVPVTEQQIRLQQFVSTQEYILPKSEQTLNALWNKALNNFSEQSFLISSLDESEFTYEEAQEIILQIQASLDSEKLKVGDKIALITANHFEAILTILAAVQRGIVVVPLEYKLSLSSISHILEEIAPQMVFADQESIGKFHSLLQEENVVQFDDEEQIDKFPLFSDWVNTSEEEIKMSNFNVTSNHLAIILYTSGSTGIPKGVMLSHGHLVRSSRLVTESFHWKTSDRFFAVGELDSMSGLRNACFAPLEVGAAVIIPTRGNKQNLFSICESIAENKATILGTTPVLLNQMVNFERRIRIDLRSLRQVICTGSALSSNLKEAFYNHFGIIILNYYGLTETTGICITEKVDESKISTASIGKACNCIAQIVDEAGNIQAAGEKGELRLFGDNIMLGYFNRSTLSQKVIKNDWLYTGDHARISENGVIELLGRKKEIIKTADGSLIYTSAIELALESHEAVKEVAIVPIIESEKEKMAAFVVPLSIPMIEDELKAQLKIYIKERVGDRNIPVDITLIDKIPRNTNGKAMKSQLL